MADGEPKECPCSNITIMQLFHELKQRYPKIPDHVVSKVIEQNFHNKTACETILEKESHHYLQSYPGALISGTPRDQSESLCKNCTAPRVAPAQRAVSSSESSSPTSPHGAPWRSKCDPSAFRRKTGTGFDSNPDKTQGDSTCCGNRVKECFNLIDCRVTHSEFTKHENVPVLSVTNYTKVPHRKTSETKNEEGALHQIKIIESGNEEVGSDQMLTSSSSSLGTHVGGSTEEEPRDISSSSSAVITDRTSESGCDSEMKEENLARSQSSVESSSLKNHEERGIEMCRWSVEDGGRKSAVVSGIISRSPSSEPQTTHNYQVAVECSMQPIPVDSLINRDQTRSFTSVNLCLRPPSSEPQPPIEIQSGQSLTYTTSSFDPKKGYQSQLQIRIEPGGGSTFSACRTYISTPQFTFSSSKSSESTYHFPVSHRCNNRHHLRALLEKQKERKDLLAIELRREKEKLRSMQNEVRQMKLAIARRPDPEILPKLKAEILRLRSECQKLTAAVDRYSDNQSNLPLGETSEEFYHNIYTGQSVQRETSWSCQLCTFRNHPLLTICEGCDMPRLSLGTGVRDDRSHLSNVFPNPNNPSLFTGAGTSTSASLITAPLQER